MSDLIQLNQSIFVRQFKNGKLPESFIGFFRDIPFNDRKSRDDDYNLQRQSNIELLHFPSCQIIRSWNQNHLSLKSEADFATLKEDFIQKKLNSYDEECFKPNCKACRDKTWLYSISMQPNRTAICASKTVTDSKDSYAPTNIPCLLIHVPIIWAELGWFETMSSFLLFKSKLF